MMSEGILNVDDPPRRGEWEKENIFWKQLADHWSNIYSRDWFCGGSMWVFADYSAFGTYRCMAMTDMWRLPNEAYHFFRSQWSKDLFAHIACHWNWDVPEGSMREVTVFHNGEKAELFLNDKSLGIYKPNTDSFPNLPHPPATWQVPFTPGALRVEIHREGSTVEDIRYTEGQAARIRWIPETDIIAGNGQDIAFLVAKVEDAEGNRCYSVDGNLTVLVEGPARRTGPKELELRGGLARFALRSTGGAGSITVTGIMDGLPKTETHLQANNE